MMITGLIIYSTAEIGPIEYNDNFFTIYITELKINGFSFYYCKHMDCYNYIANYFINRYNNTII